MTVFAIQRGAREVCSWDLISKQAKIPSRIPAIEDVVLIGELDRLCFVLSGAEYGVVYQIKIGDVRLVDILGSPIDAISAVIDGRVFWREATYFESARGITTVTLESRTEAGSEMDWRVCLRANLYVIPSKLGEERYLSMAADLEALSRGLLIDLYGKSNQTSDRRIAAEGSGYRPPTEELALIERLLDRLAPTLFDIGRRPASRIHSESRVVPYWGTERLSPATSAEFCRRGVALSQAQRPVRVRSEMRCETFDVVEHRMIRAALKAIAVRARICRHVATSHAQAIVSERGFRDVRFGSSPSLFEVVDLPRIRRLKESSIRAGRAEMLACSLMDLPYLKDVPAEVKVISGGVFGRNSDYQRVSRLLQGYLAISEVGLGNHASGSMTKLTSRLFEQWCFLKVVDSFRLAGLELREWSDALRQHLLARFVLDFERGLSFEGEFGTSLRVRIRYEPWIFSQNRASAVGETLCRGAAQDTPWSPDITIECLQRDGDGWRVVYALVVDSKYVAQLTTSHWEKTAKYLEIRRTQDRRQVVRQLWLVAPGAEESITCEDPSVTFNEYGASCASDEAVRFTMIVAPPLQVEDESSSGGSAFLHMARGTLAYFMREFGTVSSS